MRSQYNISKQERFMAGENLKETLKIYLSKSKSEIKAIPLCRAHSTTYA